MFDLLILICLFFQISRAWGRWANPQIEAASHHQWVGHRISCQGIRSPVVIRAVPRGFHQEWKILACKGEDTKCAETHSEHDSLHLDLRHDHNEINAFPWHQSRNGRPLSSVFLLFSSYFLDLIFVLLFFASLSVWLIRVPASRVRWLSSIVRLCSKWQRRM